MTIQEDESLKAVAHGLIIGAVALPLVYNISIRKWRNVLLYSTLIAYEVAMVIDHIQSRKQS